MAKCKNLHIEQKAGDNRKLLFKWTWPWDLVGVDRFEVIPHYIAYNGRSWISGDRIKVDPYKPKSGGYYFYEWSVPAAASAYQVCFEVACYHDDTEYWVVEFAMSKTVDAPEWKSINSTYNTASNNASNALGMARANRNSAVSYETKAAVEPTGTPAQKRNAAKYWEWAGSNWANAAKNADTASKAAAEAVTAAGKIGISTDYAQGLKTSADAIKSEAPSRQKTAEQRRDDLLKKAEAQEKQIAEEDAKQEVAAARKRQRDAMVGNAVKAWNDGASKALSANSYFSSRSYGTAQPLYSSAAALFSTSAYWYGEAVGYAATDDDKRYLNGKKADAGSWASTYQAKVKACEDYIDAQADLMVEQSQTPAAPSVSYTQGKASICLDVDCSAIWTDELRIYRDVDGQGKWPLVHTIKRTLPKAYNSDTGRSEYVGSAWFRQRWYDTSIADGHSYRYTARSATIGTAKRLSDISGISETFKAKPTRPEDLALALDGYDEEGKANVLVTWRNTSNVADSIEVQYTTWYGTDNAWNLNALDRITTVNAMSGASVRHTLTGIEQGKTLYVRVRAVNSTGAAWGYLKGGKDKNYATAALKIPEVPPKPLNAPTALKAALASGSSSSVTLTWTDKLESGATYSIEHSHNPRAWDTNAVGDITTEEYQDSSGGQSTSSTKTYTVTGLETGTRYFRVRKVLGERQAFAQTATGASRYTANTCVASVPVPPAPSLPIPVSFAAGKSGDTSIMLTWNDAAQAEGDTYDVQYADYASAFTDNAVGDIQTATFEERTSATQKRLTLTSLERGRTWYIRVRKKNSTGASAWTVIRSVKLAGETIRQPTGLKLALVGTDYTRINATWTDAPESGSAYKMRIAPTLRAFENNALQEITEYDYDPGVSTADKVCQYEFTGLEPGTTYYVQAVKTKDALRQQAKAQSGKTKANTYTAFLKLPAVPVASITVPTNVRAVPRSAGGVLVVEGDGTKAAAQVSWSNAQSSGETYEVQYTDDGEAFADNAIGYIQSLDFDGSGGSSHTVAVTGLDRGRTWYFRVRKKAESGQGDWSATASCMIEGEQEPAEEIAAPTAIDTLAGYASDEAITLAWVHNSAQESTQSGYQVEVTVTKPGGLPTSRVVEAMEPTDGSTYTLDVGDWGLAADGTRVEWRVRTCGAQFRVYGPWSRTQSFQVFARPAASVSVPSEVHAFPIEVEASAVSSGGGSLSDENAAISYTVEIVAGEGFEYEDRDGTMRHVAEGEVVFTRTIDSRDEGFDPSGWVCAVGAMDARIIGGIAYNARATVLTAQGMRAEAEVGFTAYWDDTMPDPFCTAERDLEGYTVLLAPFCGSYSYEEGPDVPSGDVPPAEEMTADERDAMDEWVVTPAPQDYASEYIDGPAEPIVMNREVYDLRENTVLSVYRVTPSGPVEIATNMPNDGSAACLDPHPDFGSTTYRAVATDTETGLQSAYEFEVEMPIDRIVVQWDEQWVEGGVESFFAAYMGNRIELNHNMETSETYAQDAALREYAGRSHPVSYYGTQQGQTASIGGVLVKGYEEETLRKVRELAAWRGDAYVREPLGTGYWANVRPSVSSTFGSAAISVTLDVARVEGGA